MGCSTVEVNEVGFGRLMWKYACVSILLCSGTEFRGRVLRIGECLKTN